MSYKYLPDEFTITDACASIRADMREIAEIMARGEREHSFEDLYLSIINTIRDLEANG